MKRRQTGAVIVEFAAVLLLFFMFVFGIVDFSRLLYTWQVANEATREGARYAVACATPGDNVRIMKRMQALMPQIASTNVTVDWEPAKCGSADCEAVRVSLTNLDFNWISPIPGILARPIISLPGFSTYLQREMMSYNDKIC